MYLRPKEEIQKEIIGLKIEIEQKQSRLDSGIISNPRTEKYAKKFIEHCKGRIIDLKRELNLINQTPE